MTKARTLADFDTTSIPASVLTGALPALNGSALTNLAAGGKVVQTVHHTIASKTITTSDSIGFGTNARITPTDAKNNILVFTSGRSHTSSTSSNEHALIKLRNGTTDLVTINDGDAFKETEQIRQFFSYNHLIDPADTSNIDLDIYIDRGGSGSSDFFYVNVSITAFEIAA